MNFCQAFSRGDESDLTVPDDDFKWIRDWDFDFARPPMDDCRVMTRAAEKIRQTSPDRLVIIDGPVDCEREMKET